MASVYARYDPITNRLLGTDLPKPYEHKRGQIKTYPNNEASKIPNYNGAGNFGKVLEPVKPPRDAEMEGIKKYMADIELLRRSKIPSSRNDHFQYKQATTDELMRRFLTNRDMNNFFKQFSANPEIDDNGNVVENALSKVKAIKDQADKIANDTGKIGADTQALRTVAGNVALNTSRSNALLQSFGARTAGSAGVHPTVRNSLASQIAGTRQHTIAPSELQRHQIGHAVQSQLYAGHSATAGDLLRSPEKVTAGELVRRPEGYHVMAPSALDFSGAGAGGAAAGGGTTGGSGLLGGKPAEESRGVSHLVRDAELKSFQLRQAQLHKDSLIANTPKKRLQVLQRSRGLYEEISRAMKQTPAKVDDKNYAQVNTLTERLLGAVHVPAKRTGLA